MSYRDALGDMRRQRNMAWVQFAVMSVVALVMAIGWIFESRQLPALHIPPDLSRGAVVVPGEVPTSTIYSFALYVWQELNSWPTNGKSDYAKAIYQFAPYLTPRFREELTLDMKRRGRSGELDERLRGLQVIPGHYFDSNSVEKKGADVWVVWLDLVVSEHFRQTEVKRVNIRYPLRVVRLDIDPSLNPFGLALAGFATNEGPRVLDDSELTMAQR